MSESGALLVVVYSFIIAFVELIAVLFIAFASSRPPT